jgi:hypothetical protein
VGIIVIVIIVAIAILVVFAPRRMARSSGIFAKIVLHRAKAWPIDSRKSH